MSKVRFRIVDLLSGRTMIESDDVREIQAFWDENHRRGYDEWRVEGFGLRSKRGIVHSWTEVPGYLLRRLLDPLAV